MMVSTVLFPQTGQNPKLSGIVNSGMWRGSYTSSQVHANSTTVFHYSTNYFVMAKGGRWGRRSSDCLFSVPFRSSGDWRAPPPNNIASRPRWYLPDIFCPIFVYRKDWRRQSRTKLTGFHMYPPLVSRLYCIAAISDSKWTVFAKLMNSDMRLTVFTNANLYNVARDTFKVFWLRTAIDKHLSSEELWILSPGQNVKKAANT